MKKQKCPDCSRYVGVYPTGKLFKHTCKPVEADPIQWDGLCPACGSKDTVPYSRHEKEDVRRCRVCVDRITGTWTLFVPNPEKGKRFEIVS